MAFPTSSLTNNQVHKEGNRVWVYDSTLGVWDKVAANDTNISDQTGTLGSGVTFPAGHILQVVSTLTTTQAVQTITTSDTQVGLLTKTITPKGANSDFLVVVRWFGECTDSHDIVFNIQQDGTRVNINGQGRKYGLAMPLLTYPVSLDNSSTPSNVNFSTLVSTSSVIGTGITFKVVADANASLTLWNNRCFDVGSGSEMGTSEIIITEIKG
jgi:hypothetical protein